MSTVKTTPAQNSTKGFQMLQVMGGLGAVCALLIVLTYEGTADRIAQLKDEALQQAVFSVLPNTKSTQAFYIDPDQKTISNGPSGNNIGIFAGYDKDKALTGIAIEASGRGYADIIRILYGYDPVNEKIIGFYVLESKETPGLGDKIEKDESFLQNFTKLDVSLKENSTSLKHPVVTVKHGEKANDWEIDGITGATISSRAIGEMINKSANTWLSVIKSNLSTLQNPSTP